MLFFEWKENYSVNNTILDSHHQKLLTLFNNLYTNLQACQDISQKSPLVEKALAELIEYSLYHFEAEEEFMLKYEYPDYVSHKQKHEQFKLRVNELIEQHKESVLGMAFPVLHFIKDWLSAHIINVDKQYAPYLKEDSVN